MPAWDCADENWWFAIHVKPRLESTVADRLRQKGYEGFVPQYTTGSRDHRKISAKEGVLFPGYVFCRMLQDASGLVVTTPGVIRIVGMGNRPTPIAPFEISAVRRVCEAGYKVEPCPFVGIGDWVMINEGPLAGIAGIISQLRNKTHVVLSITQCMRSIAVEVDKSIVSPMGKIEPVRQQMGTVRLLRSGTGAF